MTTRKEVEQELLEVAGLAQTGEIFKTQGQVKFYLKEQPIYYDENCIWWMWCRNDLRWKVTDEVDILNRVEDLTGEDIITPKKRTEILNSLKQECRRTRPIDIQPTWIQFKNKIFDVKTGKEFEATADYFVTNPIPWKMHNDKYEQTPEMDKLFEEWVGKEHVQTLYEILAFCLLPYYPIHRLFCFIGAGLNGKSCFLRLLRRFVGGDNCTSTELERLCNSRFEVTRLHKKLVCIMGETNFTEMKQTALIKSLTGQDPIPFEYKNKNPFSEINYAKLLLATNNLPTTNDKTIGWYRRWTIIDFPNQFTEEEEVLERIPDEEFESLALKCTGLLYDLLKKKKFHNEGSIEERMDKYEAKSNFLQKFIDTFTVEDSQDFITKADFCRKFNSWCKEQRHRETSERTLSQQMTQMGIEGGKKYLRWLYDGKGGDARVWFGIKWKDE